MHRDVNIAHLSWFAMVDDDFQRLVKFSYVARTVPGANVRTV
jgi:hypothetical protein